MKYKQGKYPIISKIALAKEIYDFTIYCPEIAGIAEAGQFVNIKADGFTLRRPISIAGISVERGTLRLIFEVRGKGTKALSILNLGDTLDILAPLGKGFNLAYDTAMIVSGGIGAPPMLPLAEKFGVNGTVISGFRGASSVILQDEFKKTGAETILCTEDGSMGRKGLVSDALREALAAQKPDIIYACGAKAMLKAIAEISREYDIKCQISMEERMGCGVGACLVCACRAVKNGAEYYAHVCKDGPVFYGEEVVFDE
ncbi:MAG: dihydroorotate dehydrogenase electron transfer subunit [Oscillospiraceae bacterium]|nr:dihydroorotate dehydrogenase electron transfer subunit [Oscillospiraceae bacterium]